MGRAMRFRRFLPVACLFLMAPAWAETTLCTVIQALPASLTKPGVYCLIGDLSTPKATGVAVVIASDDVVLDCNGHAIEGLAGLSTRAVGVSSTRTGVTVKNCGVSGFYTGISINGERGLVQSNRLSGNTAIGIRLLGDGGVVRNNRIFDTGIFTLDGAGQRFAPFGIMTGASFTPEGAGGATVDVVDNVVFRVRAPFGSDRSAYGIFSRGSTSSLTARNVVSDVSESGLGLSFGIVNASATDVVLRGNVVSNASTPGNLGFVCSGSALAVDNVVRGFVSGWGTCINGGGNVHAR